MRTVDVLDALLVYYSDQDEATICKQCSDGYTTVNAGDTSCKGTTNTSLYFIKLVLLIAIVFHSVMYYNTFHKSNCHVK